MLNEPLLVLNVCGFGKRFCDAAGIAASNADNRVVIRGVSGKVLGMFFLFHSILYLSSIKQK